MKFENLKKMSEQNFRRLTGVKRKTFNRMIELVREADEAKKKKGGRPHNLTVETRILMALEYLREYRTYAHIAVSYGLSESNTFENIRAIENVLIKCPDFRLPGKKALKKTDNEFEIILIDATESPIERPKKNSESITRVKRKGTP